MQKGSFDIFMTDTFYLFHFCTVICKSFLYSSETPMGLKRPAKKEIPGGNFS